MRLSIIGAYLSESNRALDSHRRGSHREVSRENDHGEMPLLVAYVIRSVVSLSRFNDVDTNAPLGISRTFF